MVMNKLLEVGDKVYCWIGSVPNSFIIDLSPKPAENGSKISGYDSDNHFYPIHNTFENPIKLMEFCVIEIHNSIGCQNYIRAAIVARKEMIPMRISVQNCYFSKEEAIEAFKGVIGSV